MFFDTIHVKTKNGVESVKERALTKEINLRYHADGTVRIVFLLLTLLHCINPVSLCKNPASSHQSCIIVSILHHCVNPASLCQSCTILSTILSTNLSLPEYVFEHSINSACLLYPVMHYARSARPPLRDHKYVSNPN